jgi:hypothetical protein
MTSDANDPREPGETTAMFFSISTLLSRNLNDDLGENDPARRRAAIDQIFAKERRKLVA